jgi:hypothetical protein
MVLTTITKKVLPLSEIPKELLEDHWITLIDNIQLQEVHVDDEDESFDAVSEWILSKYPELESEVSFFIDLTA